MGLVATTGSSAVAWISLGVAIVALIATVIAARHAGRQADAAKEQAQTAKEQAQIAKNQAQTASDQLADQRRPLVIPITPGGWWNGGGGEKRTAIWVRNGGKGPALNVVATATAPRVPRVLESNRQTLGPGDTATLSFSHDDIPAFDTWDGVIGDITYVDTDGEHLKTHFEFHFSPEGRAWAEVTLDAST